ncbi:hypothetical protein A946_01690 [Methylacidiphilum kamchatkense Kam1]|uniref:Gluconate 2-dehydrogenase subunit 3-like protein n=1 Tax=Methylacidiphilum kamchatkense Kam1 TaxID=1202785 RepID=A0A0C1V6R4_9BACT|nr:hypothetical protein [Methylacidiphilum kamchatkense]KIE59425.1 hypothetical protein A946_01690 [Methylacidiphilum kamchatkense Kam1]QDQ42588.1 hypothetical protein kam1_1363 [Methylacidiphilum kamchatkense Kam1]
MKISRRKFFFYFFGTLFFVDKKHQLLSSSCCSVNHSFFGTSKLIENNVQNNFLSDLQQKNLHKFIAIVVPHQGEVYEKARTISYNHLLESWSTNKNSNKQHKLEAYLDLLQKYSQELTKKDFYLLSLPEGTNIVKRTEDQKIFQDLLNQILSTFYNDKEVWTAIGYPGPSMNENGKYLGGYVNKGFDQLDW